MPLGLYSLDLPFFPSYTFQKSRPSILGHGQGNREGPLNTNKNSRTGIDDRIKDFSHNRRDFLKVVGGGILISFLASACVKRIGISPENSSLVSDHFNGTYYVNPGSPSSTGDGPKRGVLGYLWQWMAGNAYPGWPEFVRVSSWANASVSRAERDLPDYFYWSLQLSDSNGWAQYSYRSGLGGPLQPLFVDRSQTTQPARPPSGRPACH